MVRRLAAPVFVLAGCTVEGAVLQSEPSRLCEAGLETASGEPLVTGHTCVDRCTAAAFDARVELDALAALLAPECILLAKDIGVPDTWSGQPTPIEVMLEACTRAADAVREHGTAILCASEPDAGDDGAGDDGAGGGEAADECSFSSSCITSMASGAEVQAIGVLLETRLPGVLSACCQRTEFQERLGDMFDACTACGAQPSIQTCIQQAVSGGLDLTLIQLEIVGVCSAFTNLG